MVAPPTNTGRVTLPVAAQSADAAAVPAIQGELKEYFGDNAYRIALEKSENGNGYEYLLKSPDANREHSYRLGTLAKLGRPVRTHKGLFFKLPFGEFATEIRDDAVAYRSDAQLGERRQFYLFMPRELHHKQVSRLTRIQQEFSNGCFEALNMVDGKPCDAKDPFYGYQLHSLKSDNLVFLVHPRSEDVIQIIAEAKRAHNDDVFRERANDKVLRERRREREPDVLRDKYLRFDPQIGCIPVPTRLDFTMLIESSGSMSRTVFQSVEYMVHKLSSVCTQDRGNVRFQVYHGGAEVHQLLGLTPLLNASWKEQLRRASYGIAFQGDAEHYKTHRRWTRDALVPGFKTLLPGLKIGGVSIAVLLTDHEGQSESGLYGSIPYTSVLPYRDTFPSDAELQQRQELRSRVEAGLRALLKIGAIKPWRVSTMQREIETRFRVPLSDNSGEKYRLQSELHYGLYALLGALGAESGTAALTHEQAKRALAKLNAQYRTVFLSEEPLTEESRILAAYGMILSNAESEPALVTHATHLLERGGDRGLQIAMIRMLGHCASRGSAEAMERLIALQGNVKFTQEVQHVIDEEVLQVPNELRAQVYLRLVRLNAYKVPPTEFEMIGYSQPTVQALLHIVEYTDPTTAAQALEALYHLVWPRAAMQQYPQQERDAIKARLEDAIDLGMIDVSDGRSVAALSIFGIELESHEEKLCQWSGSQAAKKVTLNPLNNPHYHVDDISLEASLEAIGRVNPRGNDGFEEGWFWYKTASGKTKLQEVGVLEGEGYVRIPRWTLEGCDPIDTLVFIHNHPGTRHRLHYRWHEVPSYADMNVILHYATQMQGKVKKFQGVIRTPGGVLTLSPKSEVLQSPKTLRTLLGNVKRYYQEMQSKRAGPDIEQIHTRIGKLFEVHYDNQRGW